MTTSLIRLQGSDDRTHFKTPLNWHQWHDHDYLVYAKICPAWQVHHKYCKLLWWRARADSLTPVAFQKSVKKPWASGNVLWQFIFHHFIKNRFCLHLRWASNNVVCATSKSSDQPAHKRSLIRAFASCLTILWLLSYWPNNIWSF